MQTIVLGPKYFQRQVSEEDRRSHQDMFFPLIREELTRLGVPQSEYTLGLPDAGDDGRVCLHEENELWVYYIAERGHRSGAAFFQSIADAANYLIWTMICKPQAANSDVGRIPRRVSSPG